MPSDRTVASALPSRHIVVVAPSDSVFRATALMAERDCGSALVLIDGIVVGIITERDVITRVVAAGMDPATTSVESVMTRKPVCAHPEMLVTHALYTMRELGFRHFPVIDSGHKPLGVFSLRDAFPEEMAGAYDLAHVKEKLTKALI